MAQAPFISNPALVAIAVDYSRINASARGYIADLVSPRIQVDLPQFEYPSFDLAQAFTVYDNQADRLGRLNEITESATMVQAATKDYGIMQKVPYRDEAMALAARMPFSWKARAVRHVVDQNQLNREIRVAALSTTLANYDATYRTDLSAGTKWSDFNNSDPVSLIIDAQAGMIIPGNIGITSRRVMNVLRRHPNVSVALGGSAESGRIASVDEVAALLGLEKIYVGNTIKQTSKRGQTLTTGLIWPDSFAIQYQAGAGGQDLGDVNSPNFISTFQWGSYVSGENPINPGEMGLYGGVGVYAGESLVEKVVAPFAGYLFASVL